MATPYPYTSLTAYALPGGFHAFDLPPRAITLVFPLRAAATPLTFALEAS